MGCTHFFWMTPHAASCPSESHERAGWDGRRKRLGLAGATGCPGKRRAPQAARGGTGCPGEVLSSSGFCSLDLIWPSKSTQLHFIAAARAPQAVRSKGGRHRVPGGGAQLEWLCSLDLIWPDSKST